MDLERAARRLRRGPPRTKGWGVRSRDVLIGLSVLMGLWLLFSFRSSIPSIVEFGRCASPDGTCPVFFECMDREQRCYGVPRHMVEWCTQLRSRAFGDVGATTPGRTFVNEFLICVQKRTAGPSHGSCNELTARAVDASAQCYERLLPQFCALPVDDWGILASSFGQWDEEEPEVGIPQRALAKLVLSWAKCVRSMPGKEDPNEKLMWARKFMESLPEGMRNSVHKYASDGGGHQLV